MNVNTIHYNQSILLRKAAMNIGMFESFITRHWFHPQARTLWSDRATLQAWLDVEAALAGAQADLGMVPVAAAERIASLADASLFDLDQLAKEIAFAQHPLVPVLHAFEHLCGEPAAGYLHWGATTQNIFDTATALQMLRTQDLVDTALARAQEALGALARAHRDTPMAGRTHGQQALPMTLGFKLAGWIDELARDRERLAQRVRPSFPACMGGAIGTFAAMGPQGPAVEARLAQRLGLLPAGMPSRASYDRACDYVAALGLLAGSAQKVAQDLVFLQRTEIGEASEAFHLGKVGSSTMAQKRNPSTALLLASLARMLRARVPLALEAMVRMDEGDSSATNVTDCLMPEIAMLGASVADTLARLAEGLVVFPERMAHNLSLTRGLITSESAMMHLSGTMGRHQAHRLLYDAAQHAQSEDLPLIDALRAHPHFRDAPWPAGLARALDSSAYVGASALLTDQVLVRACSEPLRSPDST
jgi:3-carboxy-cis,cis-muconate cycloisomerase